MPITTKAEYAARAMIHLAVEFPNGKPVKTDTIAIEEHISKKYLEQILLELKKNALVVSKPGLHGGYMLARPPEKISIAEIIRTVEGPLAPVQCVSQTYYIPCSCVDESRCALRTVWQEARNKFVEVLERITLDEVVRRGIELEKLRTTGI